MIYRNTFLFFTLILICAIPASAQKLAWGMKGGVTLGAPVPDDIDREVSDGHMGLGPVFGLFVNYELSKRFNLHMDMLYTLKSAEYEQILNNDTLIAQQVLGQTYYLPTYYTAYATGRTNFSYLEFPVQASYSVGKRVFLKFGLYLGYLLGGSDVGEAEVIVGDGTVLPPEMITFNNEDALRNMEFGLNGGITYETPIGLDFDFRISRSLGNLYEDGFLEGYGAPYNKVFHTYLQWTIGYRIKKE